MNKVNDLQTRVVMVEKEKVSTLLHTKVLIHNNRFFQYFQKKIYIVAAKH